MAIQVIIAQGHKLVNQRWFVKKKKWLPTECDGDILHSTKIMFGKGSEGYALKKEASKAARQWKQESIMADVNQSVVGWEIRYCVEADADTRVVCFST